MAASRGRKVVGPSLVLWPLLSLLGPVLASSPGPGARLETVLGPSSLLVRPYRGGFTLSLELEGERQVFHLSQRQQRARLWLAGEQGNLTDVHQQVVSVFSDPWQGASVLIVPGLNGSYSIRGVLGPGLSIRPQTAAARWRPDGTQSTAADSLAPGTGEHILVTEQQHAREEDYQEVEDGARSRGGRQGRAVMPGTVHPEILVVVDDTFYRDMDRDLAATHSYIVSFFNAVNMRFAAMTSPLVELNIAGIVVAESSRSLPYIASHTSNSDMLDAPACLHSMGQYYYKLPTSSLPVYDMVITLTGLDMARNKQGRMDRNTAGYAYVGGACVRNSRLSKISSVALVEDSGAYSGVVVTAHEIGHLLGAVHDGDSPPSYLRTSPGAKACPWRDGFMMSDLRRTSRGLHWSACSIKQMKHFLRTSTASCLYNTPHSTSHPLPGPLQLPGAGLSLDAQCQADRGTDACFHDRRVCAQLFCYNTKTGGCLATRPAAEGSSCGRGKHCLNGKCASITQSFGKDLGGRQTFGASKLDQVQAKQDVRRTTKKPRKWWRKSWGQRKSKTSTARIVTTTAQIVTTTARKVTTTANIAITTEQTTPRGTTRKTTPSWYKWTTRRPIRTTTITTTSQPTTQSAKIKTIPATITTIQTTTTRTTTTKSTTNTKQTTSLIYSTTNPPQVWKTSKKGIASTFKTTPQETNIYTTPRTTSQSTTPSWFASKIIPKQRQTTSITENTTTRIFISPRRPKQSQINHKKKEEMEKLNWSSSKSISSSKQGTKDNKVRTSSPQLNGGHKPHPEETSEKVPSVSSTEGGACVDTYTLMGSLNCEELFQRYAFHYCKRNKVIKKKCCAAYHTFCHVPR